MQSSKGRILYVEDHQDTQQIMSILLQMWGYEVSVARTVAEGMRLAQERDFSLYLLDYRLPDGTGIDLCRSIRKSDSNTPILFCSASVYPFNIEEAIAAGAQAYITKPADPLLLEQTISKLVNARC